MRCPECGEIFSKKDVRRNIETFGVIECQNCYAELTVDDFPYWHPLMLEEAE